MDDPRRRTVSCTNTRGGSKEVGRGFKKSEPAAVAGGLGVAFEVSISSSPSCIECPPLTQRVPTTRKNPSALSPSLTGFLLNFHDRTIQMAKL